MSHGQGPSWLMPTPCRSAASNQVWDIGAQTSRVTIWFPSCMSLRNFSASRASLAARPIGVWLAPRSQ